MLNFDFEEIIVEDYFACLKRLTIRTTATMIQSAVIKNNHSDGEKLREF